MTPLNNSNAVAEGMTRTKAIETSSLGDGAPTYIIFDSSFRVLFCTTLHGCDHRVSEGTRHDHSTSSQAEITDNDSDAPLDDTQSYLSFSLRVHDSHGRYSSTFFRTVDEIVDNFTPSLLVSVQSDCAAGEEFEEEESDDGAEEQSGQMKDR
ncbi:hypothetical protein BT96DRAFT_936398 [Gymnopus androsaceus JB14]|uniref:Uncharacterized protein n=1 Tax=Gymnopus androsaceus JB14 TaxID=1447944 RepID=A0A6A4I0T6_9AGAR|nr:hypothetical protein BT96DRAFT_936398 [Gymnopus androsaceus JB14]